MNERAVNFQVLRGRALAAASSPWIITLVALALRLIALDRKSLWLDEVVTLRYVANSVDYILFVRSDPHPPLYYLLMHYWIVLGQNEFILRLPAVMAGAAAVSLLYGLVRVWGGAWIAAASAWLLAIAPLHIWYSQETRMYALVCALGLASMLCYSLGIRHASWAAWTGWVVTTVVGLYTDYSMLLIVLTQIILLGQLRRASNAPRRLLRSVLFAAPIVLLLFAPQAYTFVTRLVIRGEHGGYYATAQSLLSGWGIAISTRQLHVMTLTTGAITLTIGSIAAWMFPGNPRRFRWNASAVAAAMAIYFLILLVSIVTRGLLVKRLSLVLFPYVLVALAAIVATFKQRRHLLVTLALLTLPATGYTLLAQQQEAWREVAHLIQQKQAPREVIVIHASYMQWPFDYYYHGQSPRQGVNPTSAPKVLSDIAASHERAWLVLGNERLVDPQRIVQTWFDSHMRLAHSWSYPGIRVKLYERGAQ